LARLLREKIAIDWRDRKRAAAQPLADGRLRGSAVLQLVQTSVGAGEASGEF